MEPDEVAEVLESRRHVRDLVCVHGNPGIVWHPGEGPNQSDKDRSVTVSDCYVVGLEELELLKIRIEAEITRTSFGKFALNFMSIDESDPSLSVPVSCSLKFMSESITDNHFIDGSF